MLKKIGLGLLAALALLMVVVATRPEDFRVQRSISVQAPVDVVFGNINDFHKWNAWNPYYRLDPSQKVTVDGAPAGVGAVYSYASEKVGEGRMTITDSKPGEQVGIKLEFLKPMVATNQATFTITPVAEGVKVEWAMQGKNGFLGKAFSMVVDMDTLVGKDFADGLSNLKSVAEAESRARTVAPKVAAEAVPTVLH